MKFQVKDEFAGRATKCPTCKNPVQVPTPDKTLAFVPADSIEGTASSLDRAGVHPDITLASVGDKGQASVETLAQKQVGRYVIDREIARGGMGAVLRGIDRDIRREVAIKFMLNDTDAKQKARFVEEAQITGQLEHPNIVPVHELGVDARKRLFFTMKMVKGRSLDQILKSLGEPGASATGAWSLNRLLTILVNICHALAYAHSRNVIHRDLKPANIMIGDFGEVYVMDWGLAKVLAETPSIEPLIVATPAVAPYLHKAPEPSQSGAASEASRISTSRQAAAELTQDGSILGTPAYMPPEQALGRVHAVDQRSDIYSLGAILYAMLTLQPPVEKGDQLAVLLRVAEGDIKKPEERTPGRAIPPELSAIAMKALAKQPKNRYPSVEAFRRDLELFLEGRSVSAKQDTFREQTWKLLKRNKGESVTAALALVVLVFVMTLSFRAILEQKANADVEKTKAVEALGAVEKEREAKRQRGKNSAPLFVQDGKASANRKQFDHAMAQVEVALEYDPELAAARLLKGQLLIADKKLADAAQELKAYLRDTPQDEEAADLLELCQRAPDMPAQSASAFAEIFARQQMLGLTEHLEKNRDRLLSLYRKRISPAMKDSVHLLEVKNGKLAFTLDAAYQGDLKPLEGLPLNSFNIFRHLELRDLSPLKGMPLERLELRSCPNVTDLQPLADLPLRDLALIGTGIDDRQLQHLRKMPLKILTIVGSDIKDLTPLKDLQLEYLGLDACSSVKDLKFLKGMKQLRGFSAPNSPLCQDLSVLNDLPIESLRLTLCSQIRDLKPLREMKKLVTLHLDFHHEIQDLSGLEKIPLVFLDLDNCAKLRDLAPLKGMPLEMLYMRNCPQIHDLTPLAGMTKLREIRFNVKYITKGLDSLRALPSLLTVGIDDTLSTITAAEFRQRYDKGEFGK